MEQIVTVKETKECKFKAPGERQILCKNVPILSVGAPSGCARTEPYGGQSPYNMFSWILSRHRRLPKVLSHNKDLRNENNCDLSSIKDPTDEEKSKNKEKMKSELAERKSALLQLPMAMQFRSLSKKAKDRLVLYASKIHGLGIYCSKPLFKGEIVIEFAGEVIRKSLTDKREKMYEARDIGCYLFRIDKDVVIDSTLKANAARFINHSCEPNCVSKRVDTPGSKHIAIFALRNIYPGEELTYDYKFQREGLEDKLTCNCGAKKCRRYMN